MRELINRPIISCISGPHRARTAVKWWREWKHNRELRRLGREVEKLRKQIICSHSRTFGD